MKNTRFICYGSSLKNLKMSIKYEVIGLRKPMNISGEDLLYLVCKLDNVWNICGKACIGEITDENPFDEPEKYYTYKMNNITLCEPFAISELCSKHCGQYWGLMFQRPGLIKNEELLAEFENKFATVDEQKFKKCIAKYEA